MSLEGRVKKLEGVYTEHRAPGCASCGLRHVQPLTLNMVRGIIGPMQGHPNPERWRAQYPPSPPLCLCRCCKDDWRIAELTHPGLRERALTRWQGC
jgi:hypothetical protein